MMVVVTTSTVSCMEVLSESSAVRHLADFGRVEIFSVKQKTISWCGRLADFDVPNKIHSVMIWRRLKDGLSHDFFVANVNVNADDRPNANVNRFSNDNVWNAENRNRVVVPKLTVSPVYLAGVFFCKPFLQPPNCRPISSNCCDKSAY